MVGTVALATRVGVEREGQGTVTRPTSPGPVVRRRLVADAVVAVVSRRGDGDTLSGQVDVRRRSVTVVVRLGRRHETSPKTQVTIDRGYPLKVGDGRKREVENETIVQVPNKDTTFSFRRDLKTSRDGGLCRIRKRIQYRTAHIGSVVLPIFSCH